MYKNNQGKTLRIERQGFTLLELLVVVTILALGVLITTSVFFDKANQTRFERTVESMEEIKKAILGVTSGRVRGDVRFAGYVQDIGGLPQLCEVKDEDGNVIEDESGKPILMPKGLWTDDPKGTPDNENDDIVLFKEYRFERGLAVILENFRLGWRGPYLKPPSRGVFLTDGWGNPFIFNNIDGDFVITSLGADGEEGGDDFDEDITSAIKKSDYMSSVSGYISPHCEEFGNNMKVRIYYTPAAPVPSGCGKDVKDCLEYMETIAKPDGYFYFEDVPIGTQRLLWVLPHSGPGYKIAVEPGTMWLGTPGMLH